MKGIYYVLLPFAAILGGLIAIFSIVWVTGVDIAKNICEAIEKELK